MNLFIDPGAKKAGAAIYSDDGRLVAAWLATGEHWVDTADEVIEEYLRRASRTDLRTVGVEKMQIYDSTPLAHANACILLSLMAGRVTGHFYDARTVAYLPKTWKGQVPKKIHTQRIQDRLLPRERELVELPPTKEGHHDIWDAVGIGQYHFKKERRELRKV